MNNPQSPNQPFPSIHIPNPRLQHELDQAEQLLAEKRAQKAAPLFVQVAQATEQSGYPRQAANVYTRAAHAYTSAGDADNALANAHQALDAFIELGMPKRITQFYPNILLRMEKRGMAEAVQDLRVNYQEAYKSAESQVVLSTNPSGELPAECPHCGAPLQAEDITWRDNRSFPCPYCGAIVMVEGI